jgi:uncharacterized membrane protein
VDVVGAEGYRMPATQHDAVLWLSGSAYDVVFETAPRAIAPHDVATVVWFSCWIGLGVERYPYGLLTMIVSLEAIFLSTFVMISQNRADAKRQVIANQQWQTVKEEDKQNEQLLELSNQILELTRAIHESTILKARTPSSENA